MTPQDLIVPPPSPRILDYPASLGVGIGVVFTTILLYVSGRFDPTHGVLTISIIVVLGFMGVVTFCVFFTIPSDETTSTVIGGLTAAFGAIIAYWLAKGKDHFP